MTEMFGEAWSPMSVPDLAPDDDEYTQRCCIWYSRLFMPYLWPSFPHKPH